MEGLNEKYRGYHSIHLQKFNDIDYKISLLALKLTQWCGNRLPVVDGTYSDTLLLRAVYTNTFNCRNY